MSSSGALRLNLAGALCARGTCIHRRDDHFIDAARVAHECMREGCSCSSFVAGGMTEEESRAPTDPELRLDLEDAESKP